MPSLFNRRSRSVSTSRPPPPTSNSAHLAATQAFLASRPPQGNLSASAAAAALRSMSPTPTPVDQIQTKRMLNRQGSNASNASASRGRARTNLQRRPSNGSMTERTFRSPSPGRSTPVQNGDTITDAPPVPPLPNTFATEDIPPIPQRSHRRSMSLENFTTRVASPPPARTPLPNQNGTVSSVAALAARRSTSLQQSAELEQTDSRGSVNFSYPRGSRPNSPPPSRSTLAPNNASNEDATLRASSGLSAAETAHIQRALNKTAEKPVKKKKKIVQHAPGEGAHLQTGSVNTTNRAAGSAPIPAAQSGSAGSSNKQSKPIPRAALTGESSHFPDRVSTASQDVESKAAEQAKEKRAQRAAGVLMKQPSVVREDWEGEQEETRAPGSSPATVLSAQPARTVQSKKASSEANVSRKIEDVSKTTNNGPESARDRTVPAQNLVPGDMDGQTARQPSISPSRSFRFSDRLASDLTAGKKHEPLRSISPAKSALKHHSPAPSDTSPTDGNFPPRRGSSLTPSESSEISDMAARKKANRVSFDAIPDASSSAIEPETGARAQKDGFKKGWLGLGKAKSSPLAVQTSEATDEGMKPRPALPSFGSVRKNRANDTSPSPAARVTESPIASTGSLSDSSSGVDLATAETSVSSDHAIGRMLFQEKRKEHNAPLPPKVTSVEGTGYASDSDSLSSEDEVVPVQESKDNAMTAAPSAVAAAKPVAKLDESRALAVPVIAIQPATPGLESSEPVDEWIASVPGGFPGSDVHEAVTITPPTSDTISGIATPPRGLGLSENEDTFSPSSTTAQASGSPLNTIAEESSDNDSLYSDAAEDLSDMEGDGFGSINAIVESPMVTSSPVDRVPESPESPFPVDDQARTRTGDDVSWDRSQAYWSGITHQLKQNAEAAPRSKGLADSKYAFKPSEITTPTSTDALAPPAEIVPKKIGKKKRQVPATASQQSTETAKGGNRSPMAKTMRPQSAIQSANSPTSANPSTFRHSMREQTRPTSALRARPQSMADLPSPSNAANGRSTLNKQPTKPLAKRAEMQRLASNDSDSDSSFRRARAKKPAGSGFARRTMRGGSVSETRPSASKPKEMGSPSPAERTALTSGAPQRMRMTMRGSSDVAVPTLRSQQETKRSSSLFSKARKAKSPTRPMSGFGFKSKSRFADSDDEEDGPRAATYRSRFAESSDEDEPLRPVRGIPKRIDEGDSTDLEDSSDDQRRKLKITTPKNPPVQPLNTASPAALENMSPTTAKKKGLWGRLRGNKKEKEPNAAFTIAERNKAVPLANDHTEDHQAESKDANQLGFSSVAERDALVAETLKKLEASKAAPESPSSPSAKLQRRTTPQRVLSDSWPLTPKTEVASPARPVTSAGAPPVPRPGMGERLPTNDTVYTEGGTAIYGRNGKKKKFPRLRKAFGLTD